MINTEEEKHAEKDKPDSIPAHERNSQSQSEGFGIYSQNVCSGALAANSAAVHIGQMAAGKDSRTNSQIERGRPLAFTSRTRSQRNSNPKRKRREQNGSNDRNAISVKSDSR
jgi:hypothetical protein